MVLKMFSIRDRKSDVFNTPFFQPTHGAAERAFKTLVRDEKSTVSQYPEDFDLYYLGDYDDNQGRCESIEVPQLVMSATAALE